MLFFDMGFFGAKEPKVQVLKQSAGKLLLSFNEFIENKVAAQEYANEYAHIAPNRLEFMDRVQLWEGIYIPLREKVGWVLLKGNYKDNWADDRFKVEWQAGDDVVVATQDDWDGSVSERIKKKK
ncbi:MAG: hypothetical protein F2709_04180 [Actinobacteria bacterium]|nr:hypothetical protein [Actinomycetota bacterium]